MIYQVFKSNAPQVQIAEIHDPGWPLIEKGEKIPLTIEGKDGLYAVTKVGGFNIDTNNKLVIDIWVNDFFPKVK
jgi:hypothetical protein